MEEKKKEKWAHSVLAEESVVSCRAAKLARSTGLEPSLTTHTAQGKVSADSVLVHLLWLFVRVSLFSHHSPGHRSDSQAAESNVQLCFCKLALHVNQRVVLATVIGQPSERRVTWRRTSRNLQDEGADRITAQGSFDKNPLVYPLNCKWGSPF